MVGSQISRISLILYLFHGTNSITDVAFLIVLETLPGGVVATVSGTLIDRLSKRKVMIACDLARAIFMGAVFFYPTPVAIYWMAALHSIATALFVPAKAASTPLIVDSRDLPEANGADQSATHLMLVLGPVIGAELFISLGLKATLLVDILTFLGSAFLITRIRMRATGQEYQGLRSSISDVSAGWRYLREHRLALHLIALGFVSLICVGLWIPLAPFFIRDFLGGSDRVLGVQAGVFGLGGVLGAILAPRLVRRFGKGLVMFVALLAEGLTLVVYSMTPGITPSVLICLAWGFVVSSILVPYQTLLQETVEDTFLGRVFSLERQSENFAILFAMLLAMALRDALSSSAIFALAGSIYFAIIVASAFTPGGRRLRRTR